MRDTGRNLAFAFGSLLVGELVGFGGDHDDALAQFCEPGEQFEIAFERAVAAVNDRDGAAELLAGLEIAFDEPAPILALGLGNFGEAVAGQIDEIKRARDGIGGDEAEEIEQAGFARSVAGFGKMAAVEQRVDQAGFPHVGAAAESDLRQAVFGQLRGVRDAHCKFSIPNHHASSNRLVFGFYESTGLLLESAKVKKNVIL